MGCDFYIVKSLFLYLEEDYVEMELERDHGYFNWDLYDEEDPEYKTKMEDCMQRVLEATGPPILIYDGNCFLQPILESLYKSLVEKEIMRVGIQWNQIKRIVKEETRFRRE